MRRGTRTLGAAAAIAALACEGATVEEVCPDGIGKQAEAVVEARCFDQVLAVDTDPSSSEHGRVPCKLYVLLPPGSDGCACDAEGYAPAPSPPDTVASALGQYCADPCCKDMCVCEFLQLAGPELVACQSGTETSQWPVGWCYVSPEQGIGNTELVEDCPLDDKRLLRTVPNRHAVKGVLTCHSDVVILESDGSGPSRCAGDSRFTFIFLVAMTRATADSRDSRGADSPRTSAHGGGDDPFHFQFGLRRREGTLFVTFSFVGDANGGRGAQRGELQCRGERGRASQASGALAPRAHTTRACSVANWGAQQNGAVNDAARGDCQPAVACQPELGGEIWARSC